MNSQETIDFFGEAPVPMCVVDAYSPDFTLLKANRDYAKSVLCSSNSFLNKPFFDSFPVTPNADNSGESERLKKSFKQVISSKEKNEIYGLKHHLQNDKGDLVKRYWKIINTPILDDKGDVKQIVHAAIDITNEFLNGWEHRAMLNNTTEGFLIVDADLKILNHNEVLAKRFAELFGHKITIGTSILDFVMSSRKNIVESNYKKALQGETSRDLVNVKSLEGETIYFDAIYKPVEQDSGKISRVFVSMQEVTEEYKAKEQLKVEEMRFKTLVETGNDIIILFDHTFCPKYISPSMQTVLGYSLEEAYTLNVIEIVHPNDQPHIEKALQQTLAEPGKNIAVSPTRMMHKNGSWKWFDGTFTNMLHNPHIRGIVDNFKEITEQVEAEQDLKETKEKSESLIQSVEGVIWEARSDTFEFSYVSSQAKHLLGYSPEQVLSAKTFG